MGRSYVTFKGEQVGGNNNNDNIGEPEIETAARREIRRKLIVLYMYGVLA